MLGTVIEASLDTFSSITAVDYLRAGLEAGNTSGRETRRAMTAFKSMAEANRNRRAELRIVPTIEIECYRSRLVVIHAMPPDDPPMLINFDFVTGLKV